MPPHGLHEACQASLSITNSWSLLKLMSIELLMPSNHLTLCRPLLLLPSILPSIRVFSSSLHQMAKVLSMLSKEPVVLRYNLKDSIPKFKCLPYYFHTCSLGNTLLQYSCLENPMDGGAW